MTISNAPSGTYTIDPTHSRIGFIARHAMVTKVGEHLTNSRELAHWMQATPPSRHCS